MIKPSERCRICAHMGWAHNVITATLARCTICPTDCRMTAYGPALTYSYPTPAPFSTRSAAPMIRPDGTVSDAILSTITEAQRVPSIGHQLTLEPDPATRPAPPVFAAPATTTRPVPLNLWDTSADSIPDGWVK